MKRVPRRGIVLALFFVVIRHAAALGPEEPFPPKGAYNNSVHRFFPDLDARFNAVRYGRWRALQIAWTSGINQDLDQKFSTYLTGLVTDPPRFAPEADRVAPRLAREAGPLFRALRWGQGLEHQLEDVLASPDASSRLSQERLQRVLDLYRRERWALSEPDEEVPPGEARSLAPLSARILLSGTRLFAVAAEDLVASDFGQQRWRVKRTVADFDHSYTAERPPEESTYRVSAPTVAAAYPGITNTLDRLVRFRVEIFEALIPGSQTPQARRLRDERLRNVARRYGLPVAGIGGK